MQQVIALIVILFMSISVFIPLSLHHTNKRQSVDIKQNLNLSCKVVANSFCNETVNFEQLSQGSYKEKKEVTGIDRDRLVSQFNDVLFKNCYNEEKFKEVQLRIPIKILCYHDRFYVAVTKKIKTGPGNTIDDFTITEKWLPPYYYDAAAIENSSGEFRLIHLNIYDDLIYYYDDAGTKINKSISEFSLDGKEISEITKADLIINKLNTVIAEHTINKLYCQETASGLVPYNRGLQIRIQNPYKAEQDLSVLTQTERDKAVEYRLQYENFNIFDGITFFIVYSKDDKFCVNENEYYFKNYNIAGYTVKP